MTFRNQELIDTHLVMAKRIQHLLRYRQLMIDEVHMYKMIRTRRDHMLYRQHLYLGQTELSYLDTFPCHFNNILESVMWVEYGENIQRLPPIEKYLYYETCDRWSEKELATGFDFHLDRSTSRLTPYDIIQFKRLNQSMFDCVNDAITIVETCLGRARVTGHMISCRQTLLNCIEAQM
jgi:hypothetical protein